MSIENEQLTEKELEDLQLLQEIADECPSMIDELFKGSKIGDHFLALKSKSWLASMKGITDKLSAEITAEIDADIIKLLMGQVPSCTS